MTTTQSKRAKAKEAATKKPKKKRKRIADTRSEPQSDPTSVDVVCGRQQECYNHTGNRRFRYVIGFHVGRYRVATARRHKTMVVNGIMEEFQRVNGRFVRYDHDDRCWYLVDKQVSRQKVAHALRDKLPLSCLIQPCKDLDAKIARHFGAKTTTPTTADNANADAEQIFVEEQKKKQEKNAFKEAEQAIYMAVTKKLMKTELPRMGNASDGQVELILTKVLTDFINDDTHFQLNQKDAKMAPQEVDCTDQDTLMDIEEMDPYKRVCDSIIFEDIVTNQCSWDEENNNNTYPSPLQPLPPPVRATATLTSESLTNSCSRSSSPSFSSLIENVLHCENEDDVTEMTEMGMDCDWQLSEDLPQNFSERDCENLISMLDFASAL